MICGICPQRSMRFGLGCWLRLGKWWEAGSNPSERPPNRQSRMPKNGIAPIARQRSRRKPLSIPWTTLVEPCVTNANGKIKSEFFGDRSVLPFRGGNWNNAAGAGVFALYLNNPRTNSNANVGFRAASPPPPDTQSLRTLFQCRGDKGICPLAETGKSKIGNRSALPFRGGSWNYAAGACVFALNFNNPRTLSNADVGFRAALPSRPDMQSLRAMRQCGGDKGACFHAVQVRQKTKTSWKPLVAPAWRRGESRDT